MTNQIAFWMAALVLGGLAFDYVSNDAAFIHATAREFLRLVLWMRFWG